MSHILIPALTANQVLAAATVPDSPFRDLVGLARQELVAARENKTPAAQCAGRCASLAPPGVSLVLPLVGVR